jgi:thiol-disulfide isomerase/thioredoxin
MRSPLPSLEGATVWVNGEPSAESLADHPVVVFFWSISCYLCHDAAGRVAELRDRYAPQGVVFIAVHQPRSPDELNVEAVRKDALDEMHITQPCAIDNDHAIVERFENQFVPAFYVFNARHEMRHFQAGGAGLDRIASAIDRVLTES